MNIVIHPDTGEVLRFRKPWMRERSGFACVGESMTHQSHCETCDINRIVGTYVATGILPEGRDDGQYGDVTELQGDLTENINRSWETLGTLKERIDAEKREKREAAEAQAQADAAELARFRSEAAGKSSPATSGTETPPKATG